MERISIFNLEKRFNLNHEFGKLENDILKRESILVSTHGLLDNISFIEYIDLNINACPFVGTSRSYQEFMNEYGITSSLDNIRSLYIIDFVMNCINWLDSIGFPYVNRDGFYADNIKDFNNYLNLIRKQSEYILEKLNYKLIQLEYDNRLKFKPVIIVKRDSDVDSVLTITNPDTRIDLLTYLDFRVENDVHFKEAVIRRLYTDLEQRTDELNREPHINLFKDTKFTMNETRHEYVHDKTDQERIEVCDIAFYMYLHLLRTLKIDDYKPKIRQLKLNRAK